MPFGLIVTVLVLLKKVKAVSFGQYILIALVWTLIAIVCDYFFLVKIFHPEGYYKIDVFLYYILTFMLPLIIGWGKFRNFF